MPAAAGGDGVWYFAYGSNLCTAQMAARTGVAHAGRARRARLPGHRLAFNMRDGGSTYANVVRPGDGVSGVLYWCGRRELAALDGFEVGYERVPVEVLDEAGVRLDAVAYVARPEFVTAGDHPATAYLRRIVRGAREHGLPEEYVRVIEAAAGCEVRGRGGW